MKVFSVEAVDLNYKFYNICYSESVFLHNVYIKNVTFGIKIGQKFYHFSFNKFTQVRV